MLDYQIQKLELKENDILFIEFSAITPIYTVESMLNHIKDEMNRKGLYNMVIASIKDTAKISVIGEKTVEEYVDHNLY